MFKSCMSWCGLLSMSGILEASSLVYTEWNSGSVFWNTS
jgi:hypothetical protein